MGPDTSDRYKTRGGVVPLIVQLTPIECEACKMDSHPTFLCPFTTAEGWRGPTDNRQEEHRQRVEDNRRTLDVADQATPALEGNDVPRGNGSGGGGGGYRGGNPRGGRGGHGRGNQGAPRGAPNGRGGFRASRGGRHG